jgi:protease-4
MKRRDWIAGGIIVALLAIFFVCAVVSVGRNALGDNGVPSISSREQLGVLEVRDIILDPQGALEQLAGFAENDKIKGVLVRLESPGGAVGASQEIYRELIKIRAMGKKVMASMGSVAASGAFYIACAADTIMANPGTITGSIGVRSEFLTTQELFKKVGIKFNVIKSGKFKDVGNLSRDMTPAEAALMQGIVDDLYSQFLDDVAAARQLPRDSVRAVADGRILTGRQARQLGLVDLNGNYHDAIDQLARMCGIQGKPVLVKRKKPLMEMFAEYSGSVAQLALPRLAQWFRVFYMP